MKHLCSLLLLCLPILPFFISEASCVEEPFTGPSNSGNTGLMEIPTARVMSENTYRLGFSLINPYRYYYGAVSPVQGLEIDGRVTEVRGVPGFANKGDYGNYKDKAIDIKYLFLPEGKYTPAIAVGWNDPHGTRLYASQYVALSKQIFPLDLTLGFGNGRFGRKPLEASGDEFKMEMLRETKTWLKESRFFWGLQLAPSEKYSFMVEYSPIKYQLQTTDPAQPKYFEKPAPSSYNLGFRWKPNQWYELDASYQRGDKIGLNISMPFQVGKPVIPIYDRHYKDDTGFLPLDMQILKRLSDQGFSNVGINIVGNKLLLDLQNGKFFYNMRALGVILGLIAAIMPENIEEITVIFKERDVPMFSFSTKWTDLMDFIEDKLTLDEFLNISSFDTGICHVPEGAKYLRYSFAYGYKPQLQLFLNDPSGFWKGKLGLSVFATYPTWSGGSFITGASLYPFTNISTENEPLSIPVRSDIDRYIGKKLLLDMMMFEQTNRVSNGVFTRFSVGILETQYSGLDWETASPLLDGRLLLGLNGSIVKKRDTDNPFWVKRNDTKDVYTPAFVNARLNFPASEISLDLKYGRFLAGDVGTRITVSKFIKSVVLSAWYSATDTSVFSDTSNRGYHDKGFSVLIPIRLFLGTDSRAVYSQSLSPWTRDAGQDISHFNPLFDFMGRNTNVFLNRDRAQWQ